MDGLMILFCGELIIRQQVVVVISVLVPYSVSGGIFRGTIQCSSGKSWNQLFQMWRLDKST